MEPVDAGERWVQKQVDSAREPFERGADGLAFATIEEYEASLRGQVAAFLASVDEYVGRTVAEARELARGRRERLCVHPPSAHRLHLAPLRVHVLVEAGAIVAARRDEPAWLTEVTPEHPW